MTIPLHAISLGALLVTQGPVHYEVSFENAVHHEARIEATFTDLAEGPLELRMSRSSPGRYALHEFAKNVYAVRAQDGAGRELAITRPDPHGWNVEGHDGTVRVAYTLYGDRADGTYTGIDATHAHLNMPATFMWARGLERRPVTVEFHPPAGSDWSAATQLAPAGEPMRFEAPDLDYFLDSPTELSDFTLRSWQVGTGAETYTIRLAVHHEGSERDVDEYEKMVRPVVEQAAALFGGYPRFDYGTYTFIADYLPYVAGDGMEHRNSTILSSTSSLADNALGLLGTVAHEVIHAWNVERIRPRSLEPFDFERANMSGALWFGEGFTSYYDDILIRRAGLIDDEAYARRISGTINAVANATGRRFFSPVEMSMQALFVDAATSIDPTNQANTFLSYYTWGAAIGLGLDLTLRTRFPGLTLDDYMRAVWREHGANEVPYTLDDLESVLADLTGDPAFAADFFRAYVYGHEVVDYRELLAAAGLILRLSDPGGPTLGAVQLRYGSGGARITANTLVGTPLYEAGLDRGDLMVRLDGRPIRAPVNLRSILEAHRPGDELTLEFVGRRGNRRTTVVLADNPNLEVVTYEEAGLPISAEMRAFRVGWLGGDR